MPVRVRKDWRVKGGKKPPDVIDCTRPGPFGNPWVVGRDGTRWECLAKFKDMIYGSWSVSSRAKLQAARGLACACPLDESCHVDVIIEWLQQEPSSSA